MAIVDPGSRGDVGRAYRGTSPNQTKMFVRSPGPRRSPGLPVPRRSPRQIPGSDPTEISRDQARSGSVAGAGTEGNPSPHPESPFVPVVLAESVASSPRGSSRQELSDSTRRDPRRVVLRTGYILQDIS